MVCGTWGGGGVHLIDIEGVESDPIVMTALEREGALTVRCVCFKRHPIERSQLGQVIPCPSPDCDLQLRINPFVIELQEPAPR